MTGQKTLKSQADAEQMLSALEEVAAKIGVEVRYENLSGGPIKTTHGSCKIRGIDVILIDRRLAALEKLHALGYEMRRFDLEEVFIPPAVRRFLGIEVD